MTFILLLTINFPLSIVFPSMRVQRGGALPMFNIVSQIKLNHIDDYGVVWHLWCYWWWHLISFRRMNSHPWGFRYCLLIKKEKYDCSIIWHVWCCWWFNISISNEFPSMEGSDIVSQIKLNHIDENCIHAANNDDI